MASLISHFVSANARVLRLLTGRRSRKPLLVESKARILCFIAGGTTEMIDTLPLLQGLRRHYPRSLIAVACEPEVAPLAQACKAVNVVILYRRSRIPWLGMLKNGIRFQHFDWALVATPRFNWRLAVLARLSNGALRIGFERKPAKRSEYYTDPIVLLGDDAKEEHRIETLMRLLKPLGLINQTNWGVDLSMRLPQAAMDSAEEIRSGTAFTKYPGYALINLTGSFRQKFREEDLIALFGRILGATSLAIGLVADASEVQVVRELAMCMGSDRMTVVEAMNPIEMAALLKPAAFLITTQNEAAHLAATMGTPTLILWLDGPEPFKTKRSRGRNQFFIRPEPEEKTLALERIWQALQPILALKKIGVEKQWSDLQELPPKSDFMS